ncbi:MAG: hypothetical protein ACTSR2_01455 [Candidatus Hodarchaeales archaeon]
MGKKKYKFNIGDIVAFRGYDDKPISDSEFCIKYRKKFEDIIKIDGEKYRIYYNAYSENGVGWVGEQHLVLVRRAEKCNI